MLNYKGGTIDGMLQGSGSYLNFRCSRKLHNVIQLYLLTPLPYVCFSMIFQIRNEKREKLFVLIIGFVRTCR